MPPVELPTASEAFVGRMVSIPGAFLAHVITSLAWRVSRLEDAQKLPPVDFSFSEEEPRAMPPLKRRRILSFEDEQRILAMVRQGTRKDTAARIMGCSEQTIYNVINQKLKKDRR